MRHVVIMAATSSLGLMSVFIVDFIDLYFISLLKETAITAGLGYAGTVIFFNMSSTIGLMIAVSAIASRRLGRGDENGAQEISSDVLILGLIYGVVLSAIVFAFAPQILSMIGAKDDALAHAVSYLRIVVVSLPLACVGMVGSGILRASWRCAQGNEYKFSRRCSECGP